MIIEIENQVYIIKFQRTGENTYAWLFRIDNGDFKFPSNTGLVGIAKCSKKDQYKKSTGRKVALTKLFKRMNEISAGDTKPEFNLTKEERQRLWNIYFETHKK